ncbi:2753_t:CDS:2, partial [Scutellospora calospora]
IPCNDALQNYFDHDEMVSPMVSSDEALTSDKTIDIHQMKPLVKPFRHGQNSFVRHHYKGYLEVEKDENDTRYQRNKENRGRSILKEKRKQYYDEESRGPEGSKKRDSNQEGPK